MNIKAILSRIDTNNVRSIHPLRTTEISGFFDFPPQKDRPFFFFSTPLTEGMSFRKISTSIVQEVKEELDGFTFKTLNSTYNLKILKEE